MNVFSLFFFIFDVFEFVNVKEEMLIIRNEVGVLMVYLGLFDFVFIVYLMMNILGIIYDLL